ncbi:non-canonical purine NTP diphosphatase [Maribacter sp. 4G9]|uniref:non-canonical purine NTP diphosphatase n=1 Tax=Maribacter sp. 4G9 TaxID=1889777 RepID=UPI000C151FDE|nr:non-canonical purine NTP diphosphatase [Maribacter sp. 4G9]PIB27818.1 non-canonical purine NTP pyrophosphatase [Maribacter sp. 4G9]
MKLVFATHNQNKVREVQQLLPSGIELVSLNDLGITEVIPETANTLEGNAKLKSDYVYKNYNLPCFADDTGLLVDALNGEPGVYSARYAGTRNDAHANMDKLLKNLADKENRSAHFKTVISLNLTGKTLFFEGIVTGEIITSKKGDKGFGYDPIFRPEGYKETFAELPLEIKNKIGHRGKAFSKLITHLNTHHATN